MMAKTPSLNASIREVGISPTLNSLNDDLCRLMFYSTKPGSVNSRRELPWLPAESHTAHGTTATVGSASAAEEGGIVFFASICGTSPEQQRCCQDQNCRGGRHFPN